MTSLLMKVGIGAVIFAGVVLLWQADRTAQFQAGRQAERAASIERANELIQKRARDDEEINGLDDAGLCAEFGYQRLPDGTCG